MKSFYETIIAGGGFAGEVFDITQGPADIDVIDTLLGVGNGSLTENTPINIISTGTLGAARSLNITATEQDGRLIFLSVRNTDIASNNLTIIASTSINGGVSSFVVNAQLDYILIHESGGDWRVTPTGSNSSSPVLLSSPTLGDTIYGNSSPVWAKLSGNTTATRKFLRQTGTGAISAAPAWDTILAADIPGSALTKTDDTNVTLTLGGTPATALLASASLTLGWTGQLAISRGGTGQSTALAAFNALSPLTTRGDLLTRDATNNIRLGVGGASTLLQSNGTDPSWGTINLLSAFHGDTLAASVVRGDLIVGNSTPNWSRLAIGSSGKVLHSNGIDASWQSLVFSDLPSTITGVAFVTIGNDANLTGERALTGTANQIIITDSGANSTVVLSTPQNINVGASPTFTGLTLSGLTANSFLYSGVGGLLSTTTAPLNGQLLIGSTGTTPAIATISQGATNGVVITNGAGSITLDTTQDIRTTASPTFAGLVLTGALNMSTNTINNVVDPTSAQQAATKNYVDTVAQGLAVKNSARAATTGALPAYTYLNGVLGVGATLTKTVPFAALPTQDGVTLAIGDRLLVKDETSGNAPYNGIYTVTATGSGVVPWILTRTLDDDTAADQLGAYVFVAEGTVNNGSGFTQTTDEPIVMGTTALLWTQFTGAAEITAGAGLSKSGNTLSVATGGVTNTMLASMAANTIKGNNTGSSAAPLDLTVSQVNTLLGTLLANGSVAMTGDLNLNSHNINNVDVLTVNDFTITELASGQLVFVGTEGSYGGALTGSGSLTWDSTNTILKAGTPVQTQVRNRIAGDGLVNDGDSSVIGDSWVRVPGHSANETCDYTWYKFGASVHFRNARGPIGQCNYEFHAYRPGSGNYVACLSILTTDTTNYIQCRNNSDTDAVMMAFDAVGPAVFTEQPGSSFFDLGVAETRYYRVTATSIAALSTAGFSWTSGAINAAVDLNLIRDGAGALGIHNGTNACQAEVYRTLSGNNWERVQLQANGTNFDLYTIANGTGTNRPLRIYTSTAVGLFLGGSGGQDWTINTGGSFLPVSDNAVQIGSSAKRVVSVNTIGTGYLIWTAASDANASASLSAGTLSLGIGGATALDVILAREAAAILQLKNGSTAQTLKVYGSSTKFIHVLHDGTNGQVNVSSGALSLATGGSNRWNVSATDVGDLVAAGNARFSHGTSALATNATTGFFHINSCAGAPTGVPANIASGQIPAVYDTTNNKIWFYNGSWRGVVVS